MDEWMEMDDGWDDDDDIFVTNDKSAIIKIQASGAPLKHNNIQYIEL